MRRTSSGKAKKVCSVPAPKELLSSQLKAQARIDEVKNPVDCKLADITVPEKKQRSW